MYKACSLRGESDGSKCQGFGNLCGLSACILGCDRLSPLRDCVQLGTIPFARNNDRNFITDSTENAINAVLINPVTLLAFSSYKRHIVLYMAIHNICDVQRLEAL